MEKVVEICCGGYEDALAAYRGGAKRIELNSALYLGGLTPSVGTLLLTKQHTDLKVIAMVRPRGAGFCYGDADFAVMQADAEQMMKNGADGIAFGCLDKEAGLHEAQIRAIVEIVKRYHGEAVFHRAFDCVSDQDGAMEKLIEMGIDRVLTSGGRPKAMDGAARIAALQKKYGDRIEILAGSGVNADNAAELMEKTGIRQVHSSCKGWLCDPTTNGPDVSYSYTEEPDRDAYETVDEALVKRLVETI